MRHSPTDKTKHNHEQTSLAPLLNVPEAAELLGIRPWTLRQWISQRRIPFIKIGRLTKFTFEDITAFIERNRKEAVLHDRELVA